MNKIILIAVLCSLIVTHNALSYCSYDVLPKDAIMGLSEHERFIRAFKRWRREFDEKRRSELRERFEKELDRMYENFKKNNPLNDLDD